MYYHETVSGLADDPERLEQVYQAARREGESEAFQEAIHLHYQAAPDNLLFAAWFHRLKHTAQAARRHVVAWGWVVPLAAVNGLLFWWLSDDRYTIPIAGVRPGTSDDFLPAVFVLAGPIAAAFLLTYLVAVGRRRWWLAGLIGAALLASGAYVLWVYPRLGTRPFQEQYLTLTMLHLPLLAWAGIGIYLISGHRDPTTRFAFLIKSLEVFVMGGIFVIAGGLFTGITIGLFDALSVDVPRIVQRLIIAGGGGLIPVVASAVLYDPTIAPAEQSFDEGLGRLVALLMRLLLPLTLLVLVVYLGFIPFNFREPFVNRDVLIIYNGMLFAVMALVVGATPVRQADVSPRLGGWLRRAIGAVAILALFVSLYALAAILYRTSLDRLTPNRLAFIGWNVINIGLLFLVARAQWRPTSEPWLDRVFQAYRRGTVVYAAWSLVVVLALPWIFGFDRAAVETLPPALQDIVYEYAQPILLKCPASPHIYLLEDGTKRWVDSIETFNERGYVWRDVRSVSCTDLRAVPNGTSIPAGAGAPPTP